jgi:hypothetical protein
MWREHAPMLMAIRARARARGEQTWWGWVANALRATMIVPHQLRYYFWCGSELL